MRGRPRALSSILTQARPYGGAVLIVLGVALLGAPLLGLLGAAFNGLMMFVALARFGNQPMNVLAPGLAEAMFLVVMGLIVGVVGVICHWIVEARVDRAVLRA